MRTTERNVNTTTEVATVTEVEILTAMSTLCQQQSCDCANQPMCICAWLHSLRLAENLFSFLIVPFALRQLSHWKPSVQIFS